MTTASKTAALAEGERRPLLSLLGTLRARRVELAREIARQHRPGA